MLREPIIVVLGHVDHGKTSLLDKIRATTVANKEQGGITQHIGATNIPLPKIQEQIKDLQQRFKISNFKIPGLLFIDTPGHEAFVSLRSKGSSVADLAILVVDINKGLEQQTIESIELLKKFKVPFIVAANKIDFIYGWQPSNTLSFTESIKNQRQETLQELDNKIYSLVGALSEQGFESERFDRITNFKQQLTIIPCSAKTGEGIAEVLLFLLGIGSKYLNTTLEINKDKGEGIIMEIKKEKNEWVCNAILHKGILKKGDTLLTFGKKGLIETKVRALFVPRDVKEIREESLYKPAEEVRASRAIKIFAQDIKETIAGNLFVVANNIEEKKREMLQTYKQEIIQGSKEGVVVKVDTFGAAEAMEVLLKREGIPFQYIHVGEVNKEDITCASNSKEKECAAILAFNVNANTSSNKVKIFKGNVIFHLIDEYKKWKEKIREEKNRKILSQLPALVKIKVLPDYIFRKSGPAVVGIEVLSGVLKSGVVLGKDNKRIGEVREIQDSKKNVKEAKAGESVAISINARVDKDFSGGDILTTWLTKEQKIMYLNYKALLSEDEKKVLLGEKEF